MKDLLDILKAYQRLDGPGALATVVKVVGSSYRRAGARLLIRGDGSTVGAISGGCLENDVVEKAKKLMGEHSAQLAVFDMTNAEVDLWGYGQGCNGVIHVLIEPLDPVQISRQFQFIQRCYSTRSTGVISTVVRVEGELKATVGARLFLGEDGMDENIRHPIVSAAAIEEAEAVRSSGVSRTMEFRFTEGIAEVFFEVIHPPIALILCGAGSNAIPVSRLAAQLGWQVTVIDHRPALATHERFPEARKVLVRRPEDLDGEIHLDGRTAAVIMTHQFQIDFTLLRFFLSNPSPVYVGLLGATKRRDLLFEKLSESGFSISSDLRSRVFGPIGLDVGAEDPEEIALAIIAEIQSVFSSRPGGFMRERPSSDH